MVISQKISFHLSTDETMFAQVIKLEARLFASLLSPVCSKGAQPSQKLYTRQACQDPSTALASFISIVEIVSQECSKVGALRLVMISNPDGWLLISKIEQKAVAGHDVAIVNLPPEDLIRFT